MVFAKGRRIEICDPYAAREYRKGGAGDSVTQLLPIDDREANARLIAAAPELLRALREIVARIEYATGSKNSVPVPVSVLASAVRARAAITKATGA